MSMKMSFHKRRARSESLPPQHRRSPLGFLIAIALLTATVAFAASRAGRSQPPAPQVSDGSAAVAQAEQETRDLVDERLRLHLKRLGG